ncbi:MAG TPA: HAD-IA family hydrolase [Pseudonocardia sp.]|nr:HAD-IA family hydrolase [Pseudonocardia sp.]
MRYRALLVDDLGTLRPAPGRPVGDGGVAALVRAARAAGLRTAVLSNADAVDPRAGFEALVDVVLVSGETGVRKPDPAAFAGAAARLGVPPEACLVVDDLPENVRAAAALGMTGVLHRDDASTAEEVRVLLSLP